MRIDAHAHASGALYHYEAIHSYLLKNKLDKIVLCPGEDGSTKTRGLPMVSNIIKSDKVGLVFNKIIKTVIKITKVGEHLDKGNRNLGELCKQYPQRLLQAYWINPLDSDCIKKMEKQYETHPFCMVKTHQCWHNFDVLDPSVIHILKWVEEKKLPFFIHLKDKEQSRRFIKLVNWFPKVNFIVAHMIGYTLIAKGKRYNNVYFDISAPFMIPFKTLQEAVKEVGSKRLLLGSDTPYGKKNILENEIRLQKLALKSEERRDICGENMAKLLVR